MDDDDADDDDDDVDLNCIVNNGKNLQLTCSSCSSMFEKSLPK